MVEPGKMPDHATSPVPLKDWMKTTMSGICKTDFLKNIQTRFPVLSGSNEFFKINQYKFAFTD